jgi:hypothetical protein
LRAQVALGKETELPETIETTPEQILNVYHEKTLMAEVTRRLASDNAEQRRPAAVLQSTASALLDSQQNQEQLRADLDGLQASQGRINARILRLNAEIQHDKGEQQAAIIKAARAGERTFAKHLAKLATAEQEHAALMDALGGIADRTVYLRRELRGAEIEHLRIDAEYHAALADMISTIAIEKSAGMCAFEGSITIDQRAGRSGAARAHAAQLFARYREQKTEFEMTARQTAAKG